ncbi:MAG TPA: type IV pilus assembly protein PilM [Solirubrobacteraceae bacterium]|nr:type IV pilus assembly protein PilM [Solirubrobacteraceae bacterium]
MPSLHLNLGRRSAADLVGLDIQPGFVAAVQARVNGSVVVEHAAAVPLAADTVRDGEVSDQTALTDALRELFAGSGLNKRVRVGVANQRTVLRTLELPPVTDRKELAAAVGFQAQDQVPMPLSNAVLDFHALGVFDTPAGPRQRVVLVAAQRDMIERLLAAIREAGLRPEGIDLSAFALIRSLYRAHAEPASADAEQLAERVLYLNVDGLTNLAIAEGQVCRFTRVVGAGMEGMAGEVAERRGVAIAEARELVAAVDLKASAEPELPAPMPAGAGRDAEAPAPDEYPAEDVSRVEDESDEPVGQHPAEAGADQDVRMVLERGIHDIAGEVRNSLDFHRSQDGGGEVTRVVLSGSALDLPGFADALQSQLRVDVQSQTVSLADQSLAGKLSTHRLAIAAGLATTEIPS